MNQQPIGSIQAIKVDLDERCFVFPDGKLLTHVLLSATRTDIVLDAVFAFNHTKRNPHLFKLSLLEAKGLLKELVSSVYYARTSFYFSDTVRVTINVAANGYHLEISQEEVFSEIIISAGSIWRFLKGLMMAIDNASPIIAN